MFRFALLLIVTVAFPICIVGSIVYRALARWSEETLWRVLLSVVVALAWWAAVLAVGPDSPIWARRTLGLSPGFVLVGSVAFIALRMARPKLVYGWRILVSMLVGILVVATIEARALDTFDGTVTLLLLGDHTEYAPSYSDSGFRRIRTGMPAVEVEAILGRPLDEWTASSNEGRVHWRWAKSHDGSPNFRVRVVTFAQGRVEEKSAYRNPDY